jgi:hypothetical protein
MPLDPNYDYSPSFAHLFELLGESGNVLAIFGALTSAGDVKASIDESLIKIRFDAPGIISDLSEQAAAIANLESVSTELLGRLNAEIQTRSNSVITAVTFDAALHIISLVRGDTSTLNKTLPIAGAGVDGLMPKEDHAQIVKNTQDIKNLAASSLQPLGMIEEYSTSMTNAKLNTFVSNLGLSPKLNYSVKDLDNLIWLCNDVMTDPDNPEWVPWGQSTLDQATNETPGVVKGDEAAVGKIFVEADGSMSVNGWDALNAAVEDRALNTGALTDANSDETLPDTAETGIWGKLQAVRNNLKALFARFADGRLKKSAGGFGTDVSALLSTDNSGKLIGIGVDGNAETRISLSAIPENGEVETEKRFNGKPIYAQRFAGTYNGTSGNNTTITLLTWGNASPNRLTSATGWSTVNQQSGDTTIYPLGCLVNSAQAYVCQKVESGALEFVVRPNGAITNGEYDFWVEYTKG